MEPNREIGIVNKPRTFRAVIGDFSDNMGEMICESLIEISDGAVAIDTVVTMRSDELVEFVRTDDFDLALLVLNNMIFDGHEEDVRERVERGMGLVSELRHKYDLPVIALYGAPRDKSLAEEIMAHGANFASLTPFEWKSMESAFYDCILPVPFETS